MAVSAEDLTASLRAQRTKKGLEVFYARNAVLLACRSAGIDALDIVFSDINDKEGLEEDTALAKNLGFDGKTCIHPRQIDTCLLYTSIIGAGSVVTKDIPSGVIAAGNPCRVLRRVTEEDRCRITGEERG